MKNLPHSLLSLACTITFVLGLSQNAHATKIVGNGGDICEDRIKTIRDDVKNWVQEGGGNGLNLPSSVAPTDYAVKMLTAINSAVMSCTNSPVEVNGVEKTCANGVDANGKNFVICNREAFNGTTDSDQYILVHHEFAGLAGLEVNDEDGSHYALSNQISEFLQDRVVKQLSVKKTPFTPRQKACDSALKSKKNTVDLVYADYLAGMTASNSVHHANLEYQQLALECNAVTLQQFCSTAVPLANLIVGVTEAEFQIGSTDALGLSQAQDLLSRILLTCSN